MGYLGKLKIRPHPHVYFSQDNKHATKTSNGMAHDNRPLSETV